MSEVSFDYSVSFKDLSIAENFKGFLLAHAKDKKNYDSSKVFLDKLNLDSRGLYESHGIDSDISEISLDDDGELRFNVRGGVSGGTDFAFELQRLFRLKNPINLYSSLFNDQVGEYALITLVDGRFKAYEAEYGEEITRETLDQLENGKVANAIESHYRTNESRYNDLFDEGEYADDPEIYLLDLEKSVEKNKSQEPSEKIKFFDFKSVLGFLIFFIGSLFMIKNIFFSILVGLIAYFSSSHKKFREYFSKNKNIKK